MNPSRPPDPARDFVLEVLHTGLLLTDLVSDLLETLPDDAFPGEEPGDVLIEMLAGSLRPALVAAGPETLASCGALLGAVRDRTRADLEAASSQAGARERRERRARHVERRPRR